MAAIVGAAGLKPTLAAAKRGATVALANKECLVCAGDAVHAHARRSPARRVLPVDSEHNAIFQALGAGRREDVSRIILTASGGPFRTWTLERDARGDAASRRCKHPNWSMGAKITINSATMMNKGLELIEAHHLFALAPDELDVLVHPQSIVHGLVEFRDGSVVAQLGSPDMRIPIAHCLAWPERIDGPAARLDLAQIAHADLRGAGPGPLPGAGARPAGAGDRRGGADRAQRRQRDRGRGLPRRPARLHRHCRAGRGDAGGGRAARSATASRKTSTRRSAVDHMARSLAHDRLARNRRKGILEASRGGGRARAAGRVGTKCDEFQHLG